MNFLTIHLNVPILYFEFALAVISRVFKSSHKHIYSLIKLATICKFVFFEEMASPRLSSGASMDRNFRKETDNFEDLTNAEALYM